MEGKPGDLLDAEAVAIWCKVRDKVAHALQADNPRFNADKFYDATRETGTAEVRLLRCNAA
jgi:hypothetical protein